MTRELPAAIPLGFVSAYLVRAGNGCALVDTGVPGQEDRIFAGMAALGFEPEALRLIFITHAHGDHLGSLQAIARRTHAPVLAHRAEAALLAGGNALHPRGLTPVGKAVSALMGRFVKAASGLPCPVDVIVDEELSLINFGVAGRAIHTPGHSAGSLSLLLDDGQAFVGDLCAKMPLLSGGSYVPFFGEDRDTVYASWRRLLDAGATSFHPGHGQPLPASTLRAELNAAAKHR